MRLQHFAERNILRSGGRSHPIGDELKQRGIVRMLSSAWAKALLMHSTYVHGRLFLDQAQRENALRTPMTLFQRRFGQDVVPDMVAGIVPGLVAR